MSLQTHDNLVDRQFGPRASSYLTSAVHAAGEDLDLMAELIGKRPEARAIDVGCGGGHAAYRVAPLVKEVVAYDLSLSMLEVVAQEARRRGLLNLSTAQGSVESINMPDGGFDLAVSRFSAHHWGNVLDGLRQIRRVMKPDGLAIFIDVVSPGPALLDTWLQGVELLRDPSHVRDLSQVEWKRAIQSAGFLVGESTTFRLRLEFASWIERMKTPEVRANAIRSLQSLAGREVSEHFEIESDGSFTVDTMLITATIRTRASNDTEPR
jgi:ubiquinone/menaquinone biosynthesis C-methylase UbiE